MAFTWIWGYFDEDVLEGQGKNDEDVNISIRFLWGSDKLSSWTCIIIFHLSSNKGYVNSQW